MKKTFITLTIAVGTFAFGQVGVNTTEPKSTLDVMGVSSPTVPDGVLVPRYSVTELAAKDAAYASDQNGTLVFVTSSITGTTVKTSDISAAGFYYYDNSTSKWKAVGGGSSSDSTFNISPAEITATYNVLVTDDFLKLNPSGSGQTLNLPNETTDPTLKRGKKIYVSNISLEFMEIVPHPRSPFTTGVLAQRGGILIYIGGTGPGSWEWITGS
ncbi:hypothetical protein [Chryseobacterium potabilaquae]|uniref:Uncharacterized protein n=1 Tax=Chryseobacterium potabilaquae TaxID=2675057 RepID=A0A6N4X739_9FLAO|nr:hypothetical protein [Chryseobacterium potabilaquae]CAA7196519.1 hypothetical protein CHRY9293_02602 [Chryseobacterium potabilaquae]